ncbi:hypothetical protein FJ364_04845, partial [Candidatus Dependentiae bacterium]|nr:hypothetical protein [Candidatus Dependentiae bacterium]
MKNIAMIKNAKFTIVFLFLLAGFSNQNFSNLCAKPIACIITGEQSGEDLAAWFLEKTNLHESHVVNALASTKLCTKFSLHNLNQFESLKRINILNGIENLCKELITQQSTFSACCKYILELKPDKLILVDLPWVNLRLARTIKKASPSTHITFIAPPELWFWGCWHIDTILKTYCDECIVLYPHEQRWYAEKGIQTTWLGYPYEKEFKSFIEEDALPTNRLALLPGSREAEVTKSLPLMCEAVKLSKNVDNFEIIIVQPPSIP